MVDDAQTGAWLTRVRARGFAGAMLACAILTLSVILLTARGTLDAWGRPVGTDFSNVWTAGRMALQGRAALVWDWPSHYAVQQAVHGPNVPFYGWHYPPPFLLLACLLALLPYIPAYLAWQGVTLAAAVAVARRIAPDRDTALLALGFPATYVCLVHGQNGFLTAALLGGGLHLLDRRPLVAGMLIGCLCYKPQFAPLLPLLLVVGRHWRALAAATATTAALVLLSIAAWGAAVWASFLHSLPLTRTVVVEQTGAGAFKLVSAFAAVRMDGGGVPLAYAVQALAGAATIAGIYVARRAPLPVQAAGAIAASLLATPYAFDYDMVLLGIGIAFLFAEAHATTWLPYERSVLAFVYVVPLGARAVAETTGVPLGVLAIAGLWLLAMRRAMPFGHSAQAPLTASPSRR